MVWGRKGRVGDLGASEDMPLYVVKTQLYEIPEIPILRKD